MYKDAWFKRKVRGVDRYFQSTNDNWNHHARLFLQVQRDATRSRLEQDVPGNLWSKCDEDAKSDDYEGTAGIMKHRDPERGMVPSEAIVRHFYSNDVCITNVFKDPGSNRIFVDKDNSQVKYVKDGICSNSHLRIDICRCVFCLPLHTAKVREAKDFHPSEFVAVLCKNVLPEVTVSTSC